MEAGEVRSGLLASFIWAMFDAVVVAYRRPDVQFPARPGAAVVGAGLGDPVQAVREVVFLVLAVFSRAVLLLGRVSPSGAAAAMPGGATTLPEKDAGEAEAGGGGRRLSKKPSATRKRRERIRRRK